MLLFRLTYAVPITYTRGGGRKVAKIKKFHFGPPGMVIWVTLSGKTLSTGLYLSKTPPGKPILDFRTPACRKLRLQKVNN